MKIEYVNHSIGNNFGDVIELNENLKKYPDLHKAVLEHEIKHTNLTFTFYDLKHDITESKVNSIELFKFMLKHPKSFYQLCPFYWSKKRGFNSDINLILIYIFMFSLGLFSILLFYSIA